MVLENNMTLSVSGLLNGTITSSNLTWSSAQRELSSLIKFNIWYQGKHGYVSLGVSMVGIFTNIINVLVLTRKRMQSPTNCLLTALAIADMLTMFSYIVFSSYFYVHLRPYPDPRHTWGWIAFLIAHHCFIITCHTVSMCLTAAIAIFRYIIVSCHKRATKWCSMRRAYMTIGIIWLVVIALCVPNYLSYEISDQNPDGHVRIYWTNFTSLARANNRLIMQVNFWFYGIVIKCGCSFLLLVLSVLLISALHRVNKNHRALMGRGPNQNGCAAGGQRAAAAAANDEHRRRSQRTTRMLTLVVIFFLISELPHGILVMLSAIYGESFFRYVYAPLGDILDTLVLLQCAANFWLYTIMSSQFRGTFQEVVIQRFVSSCCFQVRVQGVETPPIRRASYEAARRLTIASNRISPDRLAVPLLNAYPSAISPREEHTNGTWFSPAQSPQCLPRTPSMQNGQQPVSNGNAGQEPVGVTQYNFSNGQSLVDSLENLTETRV